MPHSFADTTMASMMDGFQKGIPSDAPIALLLGGSYDD
jgi:hypothetical protein